MQNYDITEEFVMEDKSMKGLNTFTDQTEAPKIDASRKMRIGIIGCGWIAGSHMD